MWNVTLPGQSTNGPDRPACPGPPSGTVSEATIEPPPPPSPPEPRSGLSGTGGGGEEAHGRAIIRLALPALAEQVLQFCVGLWDYYLSGHLAQTSPEAKEATTAVGTTVYGIWLASLIFSLVSSGTIALVARAWGAGDRNEARRIGTVSILIGTVAGALYAAVAWFGSPVLAGFLQLSDTATALTVDYLRWDAIAAIPFSVTIVGAAALRGAGNMRTPMLIIAAVSGINVFTAWAFVHGAGPIPALGPSGIIFGTFTAKWIGGILMLLCYVLGMGGLRLTWVPSKILIERARRILRIGLPAAVDGVSLWAAQIVFLRIIRGADEIALKAHFVGIEMESMSYLPAMAWGMATATLVGQRLGAGQPAAAVALARTAIAQVLVLGVLATIVFYFGAGSIFSLMHDDRAVQAVGTDALQMLSFFEPFLVIAIVSVYGLRGAGEARLPMWITLLSTTFVRLPIAWLGVNAGWGLRGAWMGMCADIFVRGIVSGVLFYRGGWSRLKL